MTMTPMAITAENLAEEQGVTREQCDAFALRRYTPVN
jgi:acetyl-CoA acetyltransferase